MLLGIYDDLLLGGSAAALNGAYRLIISGYPLNPQSQPQIVSTRDLSNWTVGVAPWVGFINAIAQGNELMLATGNAPDGAHPQGVNRLALSKDYGSTWSELAMPGNGIDVSFAAVTLAFGRGLFVACAFSTNYSAGVSGLSTSPDGLSWTPRAAPWVGPAQARFVNGVHFLIGYDQANVAPAFATSVDGISFTKRPSIWGTLQASVVNAQYQNGVWILFLAGAGGGGYATSTDLANWTLGALPVSGGAGVYDTQIIYFKGLYYGFAFSLAGAGAAANGTVSVSSDLKNWRALALPVAGGLGAIAIDGARLVLVDQIAQGQITYSGAGLSYATPGPLTNFYVTTDMQNFSPLSVPASFYLAGAQPL